MKSYIISASLQPGCYRHIQISAKATLFDLHRAIIDAFTFDDDHAHAFFMDNRAWSGEDCYYADFIEDEDRFTIDFTLEQAGVTVGKQFKYVFDFGDDWRFQLKALKALDEETGEPVIVRTAGDAPIQYPSWDEEEYDDGDEDE